MHVEGLGWKFKHLCVEKENKGLSFCLINSVQTQSYVSFQFFLNIFPFWRCSFAKKVFLKARSNSICKIENFKHVAYILVVLSQPCDHTF